MSYLGKPAFRPDMKREGKNAGQASLLCSGFFHDNPAKSVCFLHRIIWLELCVFPRFSTRNPRFV